MLSRVTAFIAVTLMLTGCEEHTLPPAPLMKSNTERFRTGTTVCPRSTWRRLAGHCFPR